MQAVITFMVLGLAAVTAVPSRQSTIVGGSTAIVSQYPSIVSLLYSNGISFNQACVGTILTTRAILTAAHCVYGDPVYKWRARVGSSWANSGGAVYTLNAVAIHPNFNLRYLDNDVAILRTFSPIIYSSVVQYASIAGGSYNLADNQIVWVVGWGTPLPGGSSTEQLRHLQLWTINQATCASRYNMFGAKVTTNMLCSGLVGIGRNQCQGDSGSPVFHNGVVVGITSWGYDCANVIYPGVSARISRQANWIQSNA